MSTRDLFSGTGEPVARKAYYSIGEVCELTGLRPHVLRYWEGQFEDLRPKKNRAGKRVFRPAEVELVLLVRRLLHEEKYTIEGARRKLDDMRAAGDLAGESTRVADAGLLAAMKAELREILELLEPPPAGRPG